VTESSRPNHFHWLSCDAYLFDIDGTLLRSRDRVHYNAMNRAMLDVYGKHTTIARVPYHGMTDLGIMRAALALEGMEAEEFDRRLPQALECIRQDVERNAADLNPLVCVGIPQTLERLDHAGKLLGVASGNLESVGWRKVGATGLRDYFRFGAFSDRHEQRAEVFAHGVEQARARLGSQAMVCFIGDTPEDVRAAQKVGARIVSVCTGVYKREDLEPLGPDACVQSCAELLNHVPADTPSLRR
jgi:phosphoglycolate phosphatase-like HAD superfamily hydrolase